MLRKLVPIFFILLLEGNLFSYTRMYLMSEVEINKENLMVSDICKMEGDDIGLLSNIVISPSLYSDSIVDNKELFDFLTSNSEVKLLVFGSGVKVKKIIKKEVEPAKVILIQKNDLVELVIRNNNIVIEIKGKALSCGSEKDEIDFKLSTGKVVKGKITSEKKAEIVL